MDKNLLKTGWNNDLVIHAGTPRVSFLGNNGNLEGTNVGNIYRKNSGLGYNRAE